MQKIISLYTQINVKIMGRDCQLYDFFPATIHATRVAKSGQFCASRKFVTHDQGLPIHA